MSIYRTDEQKQNLLIIIVRLSCGWKTNVTSHISHDFFKKRKKNYIYCFFSRHEIECKTKKKARSQ